jgi:hypothetical protein
LSGRDELRLLRARNPKIARVRPRARLIPGRNARAVFVALSLRADPANG